MEVKGLFWKGQTIGKINEVQLDLISTSTSEVVIRNQLRVTCRYQTGSDSSTISYRFCSHENWMVCDILSFQVLGHFSVSASSGPVLEWTPWFFPYACERNPSLYHFLERTKMEWYHIVPVWTGPRTWASDYFDKHWNKHWRRSTGICPKSYQLIVNDYIEITITFLAFYNKSQIIIFDWFIIDKKLDRNSEVLELSGVRVIRWYFHRHFIDASLLLAW